MFVKDVVIAQKNPTALLLNLLIILKELKDKLIKVSVTKIILAKKVFVQVLLVFHQVVYLSL